MLAIWVITLFSMEILFSQIECFHSRGQHICKFIGKKKRLHKKRVQLPEDWFGTPTWPPFHCFGTPIWPPWRHVKTLYKIAWYSQGILSFVFHLVCINNYARERTTYERNSSLGWYERDIEVISMKIMKIYEKYENNFLFSFKSNSP